MNSSYFSNRNINILENDDSIIVSGTKVLIDKKLFIDTVAHTEYLLESLKQLYGDMEELANKKTTLSEFEQEFHKLVADAEKILTRTY